MISVSNLSKKIGDVQALDGLSFHAEDGQITGLLGPNGAGKSTTMRMVSGFYKLTKGSPQSTALTLPYSLLRQSNS